MSSIIAADATINHIPAGAINIIIGLAVVLLLVRNSVRRRPLKEKIILGLILSGIGLLETLGYIQDNGARPTDLIIAAVSTIIGVALAFVRAHTIRIWREGNAVYTQGTWVTAALWVIGLGQHLLLGAFIADGLSSITLLLYFGLMILVQRWIVRERAWSRGFGSRPVKN